MRKAYGAGSKSLGKEVKPLLTAAGKIVTEATASPSEALALGILPADVTALTQAVADVERGRGGGGGERDEGADQPKAKRAAETRMHEATARIAGAGVLAFATNAAVRAEFEALKPKKKS